MNMRMLDICQSRLDRPRVRRGKDPHFITRELEAISPPIVHVTAMCVMPTFPPQTAGAMQYCEGLLALQRGRR